MNLNPEIKQSIERSVLCWVATVSPDGMPNVSPKEVFTYFGENEILFANIASPQTVKNIRTHPAVCVSFIDILVQKGFQVKGKAEILRAGSPAFQERESVLLAMTEGKFPFSSLTKIVIEKVKPIIAPRYRLYPETTEAEQVESAKRAYGL